MYKVWGDYIRYNSFVDDGRGGGIHLENHYKTYIHHPEMYKRGKKGANVFTPFLYLILL